MLDTNCVPSLLLNSNTLVYFTGQCERLTVDSCQFLPYKSTIFPNWMFMKTQSDAEMASLGLTVLASMCTSYAHARLFMCSLVTPKCDAGRRVAPCRHFCQEFRDKCSNILKIANVPMPFFECQQYPEVSTDPLCVQPPKDGAGSSMYLLSSSSSFPT